MFAIIYGKEYAIWIPPDNVYSLPEIVFTQSFWFLGKQVLKKDNAIALLDDLISFAANM